uniref:Uncharacterized protein n=1 Tax=Rhizophora mucronata TaxID=61149 RepID=A0A2P2QXF4_RHIMU
MTKHQTDNIRIHKIVFCSEDKNGSHCNNFSTRTSG